MSGLETGQCCQKLQWPSVLAPLQSGNVVMTRVVVVIFLETMEKKCQMWDL